MRDPAVGDTVVVPAQAGGRAGDLALPSPLQRPSAARRSGGGGGRPPAPDHSLSLKRSDCLLPLPPLFSAATPAPAYKYFPDHAPSFFMSSAPQLTLPPCSSFSIAPLLPPLARTRPPARPPAAHPTPGTTSKHNLHAEASHLSSPIPPPSAVAPTAKLFIHSFAAAAAAAYIAPAGAPAPEGIRFGGEHARSLGKNRRRRRRRRRKASRVDGKSRGECAAAAAAAALLCSHPLFLLSPPLARARARVWLSLFPASIRLRFPFRNRSFRHGWMHCHTVGQ
jgi:hypothetical protein